MLRLPTNSQEMHPSTRSPLPTSFFQQYSDSGDSVTPDARVVASQRHTVGGGRAAAARMRSQERIGPLNRCSRTIVDGKLQLMGQSASQPGAKAAFQKESGPLARKGNEWPVPSPGESPQLSAMSHMCHDAIRKRKNRAKGKDRMSLGCCETENKQISP